MKKKFAAWMLVLASMGFVAAPPVSADDAPTPKAESSASEGKDTESAESTKPGSGKPGSYGPVMNDGTKPVEGKASDEKGGYNWYQIEFSGPIPGVDSAIDDGLDRDSTVAGGDDSGLVDGATSGDECDNTFPGAYNWYYCNPGAEDEGTEDG